MRRLVAAVLRRAGFVVEELGDGAELLARADRLRGSMGRRPAVVVMDNHMPEVHGLDAIAALRALGVQVPVIIITAFGDAQIHARARTLGVAAVFDKPFDLDALSTFATALTAAG